MSSVLSSGHKLSAAVVLGAVTALASLAAPEPLRLDRLPLLFADDAGIARRDGVVRTLHPAHTRAEPVLQADRPWEGSRVYLYGSVIFDPAQQRYVMWYLARPGSEIQGSLAGKGDIPGLRHDGFDVVLYATSKDGVTWEKPELGVHSFRGSEKNNIVYDVHSPSVLLDPDAPAAARYKLLGASPEGYRAAISADGIHWQATSPDPVLPHHDTITLSRDPRTGEYLAYHKRPADVRGFPRRVVWLSRSKDFVTWSEPKLVLAPDEIDDQWVSRPQERTEIYDMSVYPHAGGFIGLPAILRVQRVRPRHELSPGQSPLDGPLDVELATSGDGTTWKRATPRLPMIPRGAPGTFDAGALLGVSSTLVDAGEETWVYYTAITTGHGGPLPAKRISVGRAEWRRHGFVSLDAGPDGGELETVPVQLSAAGVALNADAQRGEVTFALAEADGRPITGFDFTDCQPLCQDSTAFPLRWSGQAAVPTDRPVVIRLRFKNTRLYSLAPAGR